MSLKNNVSQPEGFGEEFSSNGSRAGLVIRIRVCAGGSECVQGLRLFNLASSSLLMNFDVIKLTFSLEHLIWGGSFCSSEELKDTMCIPWGETKILPQDRTIFSWLLFPCLCIPSFPWLASVPWMPTVFRSVSRGGWGSYLHSKIVTLFCVYPYH